MDFSWVKSFNINFEYLTDWYCVSYNAFSHLLGSPNITSDSWKAELNTF
jgi:hypothetical protein